MFTAELSKPKKSSNVLLLDDNITLSHGLSTPEQQQAFYALYSKNKTDNYTIINHTFLLSEDAFEVWKNNKLIGLCHIDINFFDQEAYDIECQYRENEDIPYADINDTLHISMSLEAVALLKEYRGKGHARKLSLFISDYTISTIISTLAKSKNKFSKVDLYSTSDYDSSAGESFHNMLITEHIEFDEWLNECLMCPDIELEVTLEGGY